MAVAEVSGQTWARKHDDPAAPTQPNASRIVFPHSLEEVIEVCATRKGKDRMTAAGSHWGLSTAAVADVTFIETHDPNNLFPAMGRTLYEVVPGCLNDGFIEQMAREKPPPYADDRFDENAGTYLVHFESGKRIYQLYAELDGGDDANVDSLAVLINDKYGNRSYFGEWALATMGGAGGQTVVGALTTGTHGGDFKLGPLADSVRAMHLVADGGRHYWIEPETISMFDERMTDDDKLRALYGQDQYRGRQASGMENFEIIRNDDVFNAVRICAGRFGVIYSVVLAVVRQFTLHEERRLSSWQVVRPQIADANSELHRIEPPQAPFDSRFLQIAVSFTSTDNFSTNLAGVTKRWNVPMLADPATGAPAGRDGRVGRIVDQFDPQIGGARFEFAGNSFAYAADPTMPGVAAGPSFLDRACMNADFVAGVLDIVMKEVQDFVDSNGGTVGVTLAAVAASGAGIALVALIPALIVLLLVLALFLAALIAAIGSLGPRLGNTLNDLKSTLLDRSDPDERAAGLLLWQMIAAKLFASQQGDNDYEAISYAVMDGHNYLDQSCNLNVDSVEVFFNAEDPMLLAYVDALLVFEIGLENRGLATAGYISLRFTNKTTALLGEERWQRTCVVEIAALRDITGAIDMIMFATTMALDPNFGGILHWGQRNESNRSQIQNRFGDKPGQLTGDLTKWRAALSSITANGSLDGFSNQFSRTTGLEVVTPRIDTLTVPVAAAAVGSSFKVYWDCRQNPAATRLSLRTVSPSGVRRSWRSITLAGDIDVLAIESGTYQIMLTATLVVGGERRDDRRRITTVVP